MFIGFTLHTGSNLQIRYIRLTLLHCNSMYTGFYNIKQNSQMNNQRMVARKNVSPCNVFAFLHFVKITGRVLHRCQLVHAVQRQTPSPYSGCAKFCPSIRQIWWEWNQMLPAVTDAVTPRTLKSMITSIVTRSERSRRKVYWWKSQWESYFARILILKSKMVMRKRKEKCCCPMAYNFAGFH